MVGFNEYGNDSWGSTKSVELFQQKLTVEVAASWWSHFSYDVI